MTGIKFVGDCARLLNRLAREEIKLKLLNDILIDMTICKLEGWDVKEFMIEIINMLESHIQK